MDADPRADAVTLQGLRQLFPRGSWSAEARAMGLSETALRYIVEGYRRPNEVMAQDISARSGGTLVVARLRWWSRDSRPLGCRFFDTDPMPPHRVTPDEPFRDRYSAEHTIRYLREIAPELPPELRIAVEGLATHLREHADRAG